MTDQDMEPGAANRRDDEEPFLLGFWQYDEIAELKRARVAHWRMEEKDDGATVWVKFADALTAELDA